MSQGRQKDCERVTPTNTMRAVLEYKGYLGHFTFDEQQNLFSGRVSNTHDLIVFQGKSIESTQEAFKDAINEHLEWCKKYGKEPEKHFVLE